MRKTFISIFIIHWVMFCSAQKQDSSAQKNVYFRVISTQKKDAVTIQKGSVLEVQYTQYINDSLLPQSQKKHVYVLQSDLGDEFIGLKEGDIVLVAVPIEFVDTNSHVLSSTNQDDIKKIFATKIDILHVYQKGEDLYKEIVFKKMLAVAVKNDLEIRTFLQDRKIQAIKQSNGTYKEIITAGSGDIIGNAPTSITIRFKAALMQNGFIFQQNMKPGQQPLIYTNTVHTNDLLPVCEEAIKGMRKGEIIYLYIPSLQAFGRKNVGKIIPAFSNLMYELQVVDIQRIDKKQSISKSK